MLGSDKLFRFREFSIPFAAYRGGELRREDFLEIIQELRDIQNDQHEKVLKTFEKDVALNRDHPQIMDSMQEVIACFDEAVDIAEQALTGPIGDEEDLLDESLETFKKGNLLLSDLFFDFDEIWERSDVQGLL